MHMQPVSSSNIRAIGYDADTATLEVAFHDGGLYRYAHVPESIHRGLMSAASHGSYLHTYIKNSYSAVRIR
jgi:hypothetical protein